MDSIRTSEITFQNSFVPDTLVIDPDGAVIKKIVGPVKLGVLAQQAGTKKIYPVQLQFMPNPSHQQKMTLSYQDQSMNTSAQETAQLQLFDSNGSSIAMIKPGAFKINTISNIIESSFDTGSLASGTYFAILLFNGTIVGEGQFVITK